MASMIAKDNATGWDVRHNQALGVALGSSLGVPVTQESKIAQMLQAWSDYARAHKTGFDSTIGEDYVLGPAWREIGLGIRQLLNGPTGRLDCGTLDAFILDTLGENGISTENL